MSPDTHGHHRSHGAGWRWRTGPSVLVAISVGGMLGASVRYVSSELIARDSHAFPVATLVENVTGSLLLGFVLVTIVRRYPPSRYLRPFFATGFLGSYTTFSALIIEGELLVRDRRVMLAASYWVASLALGLAAALIGILVARAVTPEPRAATG
jgi:fluoride exporter